MSDRNAVISSAWSFTGKVLLIGGQHEQVSFEWIYDG